jgi:hypothetical protein
MCCSRRENSPYFPLAPAARSATSPIRFIFPRLCQTSATSLQVIILILIRQRHADGFVHFLLVLRKKRLVDLGGGGRESGGSNEFLILY